MNDRTPACPVTETTDRRIVVIGGGYAGVTLAVRLGRALRERRDLTAEVVLVEPNPCQQALSELDLVAVGPEQPEFCELWLPAVLKDLPVKTCFNRVTTIDHDRKVVVTQDGHEVEYWRAVVCTGAVPSLPPIPGLAENAITMWSVEDAQELQNRINEQFRVAARLPDVDLRRAALSFTVCGGGATGVEIVGTLGQLVPKRAAEKGLDRDDLRISLVEGRSSILFDLDASQRERALARLSKLGVQVVVGSMVDSVTEEAVVLQDGRVVPASVLVWCGGAHADPVAGTWGFETDNSGRLVTELDLKAAGFDDVYALGDVAAFRDPKSNRVLPMLAQFAIREAEHTAGNLIRELEGNPTQPFRPHQHGEFVSIGPSWGIGWAGRLRLAGVPAIIMKRLTYVLYWWQVGGIPLAWKRGWELVRMGR